MMRFGYICIMDTSRTGSSPSIPGTNLLYNECSALALLLAFACVFLAQRYISRPVLLLLLLLFVLFSGFLPAVLAVYEPFSYLAKESMDVATVLCRDFHVWVPVLLSVLLEFLAGDFAFADVGLIPHQKDDCVLPTRVTDEV